MRDAANAAGQSDPEKNKQFSRRWREPPRKRTPRAVADALAMFAPHRRTSDQPCADLQKVAPYEATDR